MVLPLFDDSFGIPDALIQVTSLTPSSSLYSQIKNRPAVQDQVIVAEKAQSLDHLRIGGVL